MKRKFVAAVELVAALRLVIAEISLSPRIRDRLRRKAWVLKIGVTFSLTLGALNFADRWRDRSSEAMETAVLREEVSRVRAQLEVVRAEHAQSQRALQNFQDGFERLDREIAVAERRNSAVAREPKVEEISDLRIYRRVMTLVKQLREMYAKQRSESDSSQENFRMEARGFTVAQLREANDRWITQSRALYSSHEHELQMQALGEMLFLQEELARRVPDLHAPEGEVRVALSGHLTGVDPLLQTADYFETAAKKLVPGIIPESAAQLSSR